MNLRLSSKQIQTFAVLFCMIVMNISLSARADNSPLLIKDLGEGHCLVRVNTNQKYLLLPVEDASPDVRISLIVNNKEVKNFDVRLAIHKVDYFVPVDLSDYSGKLISFKFKMNSNDLVRVNLSSVERTPNHGIASTSTLTRVKPTSRKTVTMPNTCLITNSIFRRIMNTV